MSSGDWLYWLGWAGVLTINFAMVYLAWWALFSDRGKGRRRCPRCWYDLSYSPGMTCAECGYTATREKQLHRTRRRWGHAALAVLTCLVTAWFVNERMARTGWVSLLPTRVIIAAMPLTDDTSGSLYRELGRRLFSRQLTDEQWIALVERCVAGDWQARPPSDQWIDKYGDIVGRWRDTFVPRRERQNNAPPQRVYSDREKLLFGIPPRVELLARTIWPADVVPHARLRVEEWWPRGTTLRVTVTPRIEGASSSTLYRRNFNELRAAAIIAIPDHPPDEPVTFDIIVERLARDYDEDWVRVHESAASLQIQRDGTVADLIEPVNDEAVTDALRSVFQGRVFAWRSGRSPVRFQYNPGLTYASLFDDIAMGVAMELRYGGTLARELHLWWLAGSGGTNPLPADRGLGWEIVYEDPTLLATVSGEDPNWTMHVRGDASIALRAGSAPKFWNGSFEVPVTTSRSRRRAPPPEWWSETGDESEAVDDFLTADDDDDVADEGEAVEDNGETAAPERPDT